MLPAVVLEAPVETTTLPEPELGAAPELTRTLPDKPFALAPEIMLMAPVFPLAEVGEVAMVTVPDPDETPAPLSKLTEPPNLDAKRVSPALTRTSPPAAPVVVPTERVIAPAWVLDVPVAITVPPDEPIELDPVTKDMVPLLPAVEASAVAIRTWPVEVWLLPDVILTEPPRLEPD